MSIFFLISIYCHAQGELTFTSSDKGNVSEMTQKTLPAYIENGLVKGNINSSFGRNGNACKYNKDGIKESQIYDDGETRFSVDYVYHYEKSFVTSQEFYINHPANLLWKTAHFKYNKTQKKITQIIMISAEGDTLETTTYLYNKKQLEQEIYCNYLYPDEKYISEFYYTDNKSCKPSSAKYFSLIDGEKKLGSSCTSSYDEHGNELENKMFDADGKLTSIKENRYSYDKKGNWIRRETYLDKEVYNLTEREFKYY